MSTPSTASLGTIRRTFRPRHVLSRPLPSSSRPALKPHGRLHPQDIPGSPKPVQLAYKLRAIRGLTPKESLPYVKVLLKARSLKPDDELFMAMLQRNTYNLKEIDRLVNSLGYKPGPKAWAYFIQNAVRDMDQENAEKLFGRALWRKVAPHFSGPDALIRLILHPLGRTYADAESTLKAVDVFRRWAEHDQDAGHRHTSILSLLQALMAQPGIENRKEHVDFIVDYVKRHKVLLDETSRAVSRVLARIYKEADSHAAAVDIVLASKDQKISVDGFRRLLGYIAAMRFDAAKIMPASTVRAFLAHVVDCGHKVDAGLYSAYFRAVHDHFAPETLTLEALNSVRAVELRRPNSAVMDVPFFTVMLQLLGHFHRAGFKVVGHMEHYWRAIVVRSPNQVPDRVAVRAALHAFPVSRAKELYADWETKTLGVVRPRKEHHGLSRRALTVEWARWLCTHDRLRAFYVLRGVEGDRPQSPALAMLFATAATDLDREKCKQHFPTAWEDPATKAAVARLWQDPALAQFKPIEVVPVEEATEEMDPDEIDPDLA